MDGSQAASRGMARVSGCGVMVNSSHFQSGRARCSDSASASACSRMPAVPSLTTRTSTGPVPSMAVVCGMWRDLQLGLGTGWRAGRHVTLYFFKRKYTFSAQ